MSSTGKRFGPSLSAAANTLTSAGTIKLFIPAGQASPSPPVGPALGQRGLKAMDFCKQFNARSALYKTGTLLPVKISIQSDKSYTFRVGAPTVTWLLKRVTGISQFKATRVQPQQQMVARLSVRQLYELAKIKHQEESLQCFSLEQVCRQMANIARQFGIQLVR